MRKHKHGLSIKSHTAEHIQHKPSDSASQGNLASRGNSCYDSCSYTFFFIIVGYSDAAGWGETCTCVQCNGQWLFFYDQLSGFCIDRHVLLNDWTETVNNFEDLYNEDCGVLTRLCNHIWSCKAYNNNMSLYSQCVCANVIRCIVNTFLFM